MIVVCERTAVIYLDTELRGAAFFRMRVGEVQPSRTPAKNEPAMGEVEARWRAWNRVSVLRILGLRANKELV
jgi:hypothetical protein